jgi:hypothetical protein
MTFWKRAPRSVYSVYGEEEYLSEEPDAGAQQASPAIVSEPRRASLSRGLLGFGLLLGVTLSAIALVALNYSHPPRAASRPGIRLSAPVTRADAHAVRRAETDTPIAPSTDLPAHRLPARKPVRRRRTHEGTLTDQAPSMLRSEQTGQVQASVAESSTARPMRSVRSGSSEALELIDGEFGFER